RTRAACNGVLMKPWTVGREGRRPRNRPAQRTRRSPSCRIPTRNRGNDHGDFEVEDGVEGQRRGRPEGLEPDGSARRDPVPDGAGTEGGPDPAEPDGHSLRRGRAGGGPAGGNRPRGRQTQPGPTPTPN